ncbi:MAG TPA: type II toxin-antitoxin system HicB family antitoxin [Terriglobales bacterium]|jgi:predicted RNase H-like HicB family nuclease|nr:type II toxin-antitoxin system HicB family antitoxin [Terriglobales bacterium]
MKYAVVFEKGTAGYGAYVPDLPGCVAVGKKLARVQRLIREAIKLHIESLREHGEHVPEPTTVLDYVRVPVRGVTRSNGRRVAGKQRV